MSQVEKVNTAWDRIDKWYNEKFAEAKLPGGAAAADITALETHMNLALPEELKASLMRHNGVGHWRDGELLSVEGIKDYWNSWIEVLADGAFDDYPGNENGFIQKCLWDKSWIPIHSNGCGCYEIIDMNPGPKGVVGQILYLDHDTGPEDPKFLNLASYLEDFANQLENGKFSTHNGCLEEIL